MEKDNKKETGKTMKALILAEDLSLKVEDVPIPKPRDGEVLVKMIAAPINPSDIAFLKGFYSSEKPHPCVPGFEGSGIVV
jgi:NADPH:quinone reductase-like Zn-dependent oxidoreductase